MPAAVRSSAPRLSPAHRILAQISSAMTRGLGPIKASTLRGVASADEGSKRRAPHGSPHSELEDYFGLVRDHLPTGYLCFIGGASFLATTPFRTSGLEAPADDQSAAAIQRIENTQEK